MFIIFIDVFEQIDAFTADTNDAHDRAAALDQKIVNDAKAISDEYADIVSLATRQVMGSLDITVSTGSDGKANASDVMIFMKDIGTSQ